MSYREEAYALGFEKVYSIDIVDIRECPRCHSLVLARSAVDHWESSHKSYLYIAYTGKLVDPGYIKSYRETVELSDEGEALKWIRQNPSVIVMAVEED